jgi:hypothetical protein
MPFLMSFALEHEIVSSACIDNASVLFPFNIYATKESTVGRRIETEACPHMLKLTVRFWRFAAVF